MTSPFSRVAVVALSCAPLLSHADSTTPAATAVSAAPVAAEPVPAADPAPAPAPVVSPALNPVAASGAPTLPAAAQAGPAPVVADSSVPTSPAAMPPVASSGWMPWVPVYTVPVWPAHWPMPVPPQPGAVSGGVAYVLMWVPVPLGSVAMPAGGTLPASSAARPTVSDGAPSSTLMTPAPPPAVEATEGGAPVAAVAAPPAAPVAPVAAPPAGAASARTQAATRAATVDYGPVAPTPVVYLVRRTRPQVPAAAPVRAPARAAVVPAEAPRAAPKRRLCWSDGVVAPCR